MIRTKDLHMQMREALALEAEKAENGDQSYLDAFISMRYNREQMKDSIGLIEAWEAQNFDEITNEINNYPEGYKGNEFEVRNGRKLWSFKDIPEWNEADQKRKEIEEKYKAMFHAKMKGALHANVSEDGEELPLPEISYGKSSLIMKKKK